MSFIGSMFDNSKGAGFQASSANEQTNQALNNLNGVNSQLQDEANGNGPAQAASQAQLTSATNQGIKNAAGTVASTKGINPAMAARMAGQNASNSLQTGANQSAQLKAQMQQGALGQLSNNASSQYGSAVGGLNNQNQANAGIAQGNQSSQAGITGGLLGGAGSVLGLARGGMVKMADGGSVGPMSNAGKFLSGGGSNGSAISSGIGGLGSALKGLFASSSTGIDPNADAANSSGANMAEAMGASPMDVAGIQSTYDMQNPAQPQQGMGASAPAQQQQAAMAPNNSNASKVKAGIQAPATLMQKLPIGAMFAKGGKVPAMLSPGEKYLPPQAVQQVKAGADPMASGKTVPGKAPVKGAKDTQKNDVVPATVESGGIVLPRSVTQAKDPHKEAYKFVDAILSRQGMHKKGSK